MTNPTTLNAPDAAITPYPPSAHYHRLRRHFNPSFTPDPALEQEWWDKFTRICEENQWNPYLAIERVFFWVKKLPATIANLTNFKKGYPNLAELCDLQTLLAAHCLKDFVSHAELRIQQEVETIRNHTSSQGVSVAAACAAPRILVSKMTRIMLTPSMRTEEWIMAWNQALKTEAVDPTIWDAYVAIGIDPKNVNKVRNWLEL